MHVRLLVQAPSSHIETKVHHVLCHSWTVVQVHGSPEIVDGLARVACPGYLVHLQQPIVTAYIHTLGRTAARASMKLELARESLPEGVAIILATAFRIIP